MNASTVQRPRRIYALSWSKYVDADAEKPQSACDRLFVPLAQVALIDGVRLLHPLEVLLGLLRERTGETIVVRRAGHADRR